MLLNFSALKCYCIPPSWHRIKQCLGYQNMQERHRGTSATALAAFHAPSLKPTYVALLTFEGIPQEISMWDRAAVNKDWHRGGNAAAPRGRRDLGEGLGTQGT